MRRGSQRSLWPASCKNNPSDMAVKSRLQSNLLQLLMVHSLTPPRSCPLPAECQHGDVRKPAGGMRQGARVAQRERKLCLAKARDDRGGSHCRTLRSSFLSAFQQSAFAPKKSNILWVSAGQLLDIKNSQHLQSPDEPFSILHVSEKPLCRSISSGCAP